MRSGQISSWEGGGGDVWSRVSWLFSFGVPPESRIRDHICGQRPHLFFLALSAGLFPSTVKGTFEKVQLMIISCVKAERSLKHPL